jgi:hypothetical protein
MRDDIVRWPDRLVTPVRVAVITVSFNTRELTALLLWSLRRILIWESLEVIIVDSGSKTDRRSSWRGSQLPVGAASSRMRPTACTALRSPRPCPSLPHAVPGQPGIRIVTCAEPGLTSISAARSMSVILAQRPRCPIQRPRPLTGGNGSPTPGVPRRILVATG